MSTSCAVIFNSGFRPEDELLLRCARAHIDAGTEGRMRDLLQQEVNWKYLIDTAAAHGVKPLLCHNLANSCPESVPKTILDQLKRYLQVHSLNNLFLTRELIRLLGGLEKIGIPAIPWKGPVLAVMAYGNVALRQFGDLDILIRERDAMTAKDLLLSSGYRLQYRGTAEQEEAFHSVRKVCELVREDGRIVVELHWAITSGTFYFPLDPASLWERVETVSLEGSPIRNLCPEDLLLVLCVHGAKHHWGRLMWICDIAQLLQAYSNKIDWPRLISHARSLGGSRMLYLGLLLARDLLAADVPVDVSQQMDHEPKLTFLAAEVQLQLFSGGSLMAVERPTFYIELRERARDRLRCRLYLAYRMLAPGTQAWTLRILHGGRLVRHFLRRGSARVQ
jgi:putative nucleotidyltransferase-like protein